MPDRHPVIITISRQMASGGGYLGHLLAKGLGFHYIERQVLYQAARELRADVRQLSQQDERISGFFENLIKSFVFGTPEAGYAPPAGRPVYDRELFAKESAIMRSVADRVDAVIVGRGGYWVLRNRPNTIHIFVHAPMQFRIRRYQSFHPGTDMQVREMLEESDRDRERFLKSMTGTDRYDVRNYHVCIDAACAGFERTEQLIRDMVQEMRASSDP